MAKKLPKATHDGALKIGDVKIPCFVLEDGTRVISGRSLTKSIGMKGRGQGAARITAHKALKPHISDELALAIDKPIRFVGIGGINNTGYEATALQELCDSILTARDNGDIKTIQEKRYARHAETLIRSFAKVGIVALVDEATGYQFDRARDALEKILDKFISKELRKWAKTFPDEFYQEMFRLRGWQYVPMSVARPGVVGKYTNDLVYERLAPGVLAELKKLTPKDSKGRHKQRLFQRLTEDVGHPRLREHLTAVIALMKASTKWDQFYRLLQRALPKYGEQMRLADGVNEDADR